MSDDVKVPPQVSRKYRELGAEEPPRALDDAILAAATRSVRALQRPSVSATRPWTQRWAVPLSLAAVVVLSVTVTLRIQHEQPGIESPAPRAKEAVPAIPAPARPAPIADAQPRPKLEAQPMASIRAPEPAPYRDRPDRSMSREEPAPFAREPEQRTAREAESSAAGAIVRDAARQDVAQMQAQRAKAAPAAAPPETPERELERIAGLRYLGMHDEADKALAEFRKRFPDYTIPEAIRARVERR